MKIKIKRDLLSIYIYVYCMYMCGTYTYVLCIVPNKTEGNFQETIIRTFPGFFLNKLEEIISLKMDKLNMDLTMWKYLDN